MDDRKKHPSGRPIRNYVIKRDGFYRKPLEGYLTPRLNQDHSVNAIGFMARLVADDGGGDED